MSHGYRDVWLIPVGLLHPLPGLAALTLGNGRLGPVDVTPGVIVGAAAATGVAVLTAGRFGVHFRPAALVAFVGWLAVTAYGQMLFISTCRGYGAA